jgi:hypothetical protein
LIFHKAERYEPERNDEESWWERAEEFRRV